MNRRTFNATAVAAPLLTGCVYGQYFDIEWDEEVLLHDGRMIVVHVKRTFTRRTRFNRWEGFHRDTEISFDAGGRIGRLTKKFERYDVYAIEFDRGNWYFFLGEVGQVNTKIVSQLVPILILQADGQEQSAKTWQEVPYFPKQNLMPVTPDSIGVSQFHQKRLTLSEKLEHWKKYPLGAGEIGAMTNVQGLQPSPERKQTSN
jgi:hypothetical protein